MAFLGITDGDNNADVVIFSSDWEIVKNQIKKGKYYISPLTKSDRGNWMYFNRNGEVKLLG